MEKVYNKLVRDKIPEIIEKDGEIPIVRNLDNMEFKTELERKLLEECNEFLIAADREDRLEELADILEVVSTLCEVEISNLSCVMSMMKEKRERKGGFTKKIFLVKTQK